MRTGTSSCSPRCCCSRSSATSRRPPRPRAKISGSFLSLVLAMVFLGGAPACLIGVATICVGWLRWRDSRDRAAEQPRRLRVVPADRRPRLHARSPQWLNLGERDGAFYLLAFVVFVLALALNFLIIALQIRLRGGHRHRRAGAQARGAGDVVGGVRGAAGRRRHLPLHPGRPRGDRPLRRRAVHLPAPAGAAAAVRAARRGAREARAPAQRPHQAARHSPGRRAVRAAAHARPAGPHDRAPLRRGRALRARDRDRGRVLEGRAGPGPHRRPAARHRQVHLPRPRS